MLIDYLFDCVRPKILSIVEGDSMINCNIFDGDVIVAFIDEKPKNGDIALIEYHNRRYVKRVFKNKNRIRCKSYSPKKYKDFYVNEEDLSLYCKVMFVVKTVNILFLYFNAN